MTRPRFGLLGLCIALFGLMTFGAGAAQAEVGAQWLLAEKEPNSGLITFLETQIGLLISEKVVIHVKILGLGVLYECTAVAATAFNLKTNGSIGTGAKIKFSSCITKLNGATSAACEPNSGGTEKGVINTNALHGLIVLHETAAKVKTELVQLLPDTGETYATIEMGKECAIGTKVPIIGKMFLEDAEGKFLTHLVKHLLQVGPLTELWATSKTAEHVVTVLGSTWIFLIAIHSGFKFSGDPA